MRKKETRVATGANWIKFNELLEFSQVHFRGGLKCADIYNQFWKLWDKVFYLGIRNHSPHNSFESFVLFFKEMTSIFKKHIFWCIDLLRDDIRKVCYDPQMEQIAESNEGW